ncbi:hypothetical protein DH2020_035003 [Rehmannia glutinosa]|uniref:Protein LTV1 homolog n=1 Tax=Rehmannia glutinosa TaxID=99300 RepID=A0ABR0VAU9_REHGL
MGRKKKFIDKKKSATFQLMARDTSDPNYSPDPSDCDDEDANNNVRRVFNHNAQSTALPDHIRREILELGFPDDGYNYLTHLREIKNTGGGSAYYQNPKATFDQLPRDVKAYDASRVEVSKINDASEDKSIYSVASKTVGVRLQKVVDPEVAAMLDDSASSKYESDIDDLEEDFVVIANLSEGPMGEEIDEKLSCAADSRVDHLELHEYGADSEEEYNGYMDEDECQESLTEKLNHAFKDHPKDMLHLNGVADDNEPPELTAEVIRRCKEYAEKYEDDNHDEEVVLVEESSEESEVWDCETIISTYSTLDNHPGKIGAPEARRKKKLSEALSGASAGANLITLKGKERLPVEFLPQSRKHDEEKTKDEKDANDRRTELQKMKPRVSFIKACVLPLPFLQSLSIGTILLQSAVKLERREARQIKKEMKGLYKSEAHRAQKVAAFTGPSSIHLIFEDNMVNLGSRPILHEEWELHLLHHQSRVSDPIPGSPPPLQAELPSSAAAPPPPPAVIGEMVVGQIMTILPPPLTSPSVILSLSLAECGRPTSLLNLA